VCSGVYDPAEVETTVYRVCIREIRDTRELFHEAVLFQIVCDAGDDFGGGFRPGARTTRNATCSANSTRELNGSACRRAIAVNCGPVDWGPSGGKHPDFFEYGWAD
jgi:hypothetical protein